MQWDGPHDAVSGELNEVGNRRFAEVRVRVKRPATIWREVVVMRARLVFWRHSLGAAARAVKRHPVEVLLRRILWGGTEVQPAIGFVAQSPTRVSSALHGYVLFRSLRTQAARDGVASRRSYRLNTSSSNDALSASG